MRGSNSKGSQILSQRQRRALKCSQDANRTCECMRVHDFPVQCPAKTSRARGSTSKTLQIPHKRSVSLPNGCKGHRERGAAMDYFLNATDIYLLIPKAKKCFVLISVRPPPPPPSTTAIPSLELCAKKAVPQEKQNLHFSKQFNWLQLKSN